EIQSSFLRVINKNEKPASNQNEKLVINQNETPTINQIKTPVSIPTRDLVTGGESVVGLEMDSLPLGELIETDRLPQTNESNSQFFVYTGTCCIIFCGCIWIRKRL
ncbi:LPXTG cell wall anchor domain-containing protein, partial [Enterococcus faecalis]